MDSIFIKNILDRMNRIFKIFLFISRMEMNKLNRPSAEFSKAILGIKLIDNFQ
jgi:hypothetical protein